VDTCWIENINNLIWKIDAANSIEQRLGSTVCIVDVEDVLSQDNNL